MECWKQGCTTLYQGCLPSICVCITGLYQRKIYLHSTTKAVRCSFSSSYHIVYVRSSIGWIIQYDRIDPINRITSPITCPHCLAHLTALWWDRLPHLQLFIWDIVLCAIMLTLLDHHVLAYSSWQLSPSPSLPWSWQLLMTDFIARVVAVETGCKCLRDQEGE